MSETTSTNLVELEYRLEEEYIANTLERGIRLFHLGGKKEITKNDGNQRIVFLFYGVEEGEEGKEAYVVTARSGPAFQMVCNALGMGGDPLQLDTKKILSGEVNSNGYIASNSLKPVSSEIQKRYESMIPEVPPVTVEQEIPLVLPEGRYYAHLLERKVITRRDGVRRQLFVFRCVEDEFLGRTAVISMGMSGRNAAPMIEAIGVKTSVERDGKLVPGIKLDTRVIVRIDVNEKGYVFLQTMVRAKDEIQERYRSALPD